MKNIGQQNMKQTCGKNKGKTYETTQEKTHTKNT